MGEQLLSHFYKQKAEHMSTKKNTKEIKKISERAVSVLIFIDTFKKREDFSPSIRDIGNACRISSTSVVNYYLDQLKWGGLVETKTSTKNAGTPMERVVDCSRTLRLTDYGKEFVAEYIKARALPAKAKKTAPAMVDNSAPAKIGKKSEVSARVPVSA